MNNDFTLLLPEFLVTALAFAVLTGDFFIRQERKHLLAYGAVAGLLAVLGFSLAYLWGREAELYGGLVRIDGYALFFKAFFLVLGCVVILASVDFVRRYLEHPGEYYGILLFSVVGAMLLAASGELLTAYISLELLSFCLYVLVSYDRYNPKSNEGGTKYIILGALSSALLLYGISQIYGHLGTTRFDEISRVLASSGDALSRGVMLGLVLVLAGLGFKVAAVPFHMWAPDAYEGAPIPVTAYLAVGSKAAAFALVLRLFTEAFIPAVDEWQLVVVIMAALTMVLGNLVALVQRNIKRLLAYSSIGHVGYLLLGVAALAAVRAEGEVSLELSHLASNGIILHLVAYAITNMAAFLAIATVYNATGKDNVEDFAGLARRAPAVAVVLAASLFSLAGLPVFAGFVSKFYLFNAAATQGLLWLAGVAIFASLISLYYYLVVIRQMYIEPAADAAPIAVPRPTLALLGLLLLGMVVVGVYPAPLMDAVQHASDVLMSPEGMTQIASGPLR